MACEDHGKRGESENRSDLSVCGVCATAASAAFKTKKRARFAGGESAGRRGSRSGLF